MRPTGKTRPRQAYLGVIGKADDGGAGEGGGEDEAVEHKARHPPHPVRRQEVALEQVRHLARRLAEAIAGDSRHDRREPDQRTRRR